ncbi:hypothetical protein AKJ16_DCAP10311 [Drosera capensis]
MAVMEKLKMFVVQEPVVAASCLIAGVGLFLPAVVRPILDSMESSKQVPQPALSDRDLDDPYRSPEGSSRPLHIKDKAKLTPLKLRAGTRNGETAPLAHASR